VLKKAGADRRGGAQSRQPPTCSRASGLDSGPHPMNRAGNGFLPPDDTGLKEMRVPANATGTALHEDRVLVRRDVRAEKFPSRRREAETGTVVRILVRRRTQFVGTRNGPTVLFVIPDDPRIPHDIWCRSARRGPSRATSADKVCGGAARLGIGGNLNPEGEIVEVLGAPDEEGVDMLSGAAPIRSAAAFSKAVLHEAHAIGNHLQPHRRGGRVDCRGHPVVTIGYR